MFNLGKSARTLPAILFALLASLAAPGWAAAAGQSSPAAGLSNPELEQIIHDYLINHPEVIVESVNRMRQKQQAEVQKKQKAAAANVRPVTAKDHIRGDINAPVKIIEFSDLECPFCKQFQSTLKKVMTDYGDTGKVAWVFRHFPIDQLHPKARKEAQAAECANQLGGNKAFWAYIDKVFEVTPSNNRLDLSRLPAFAADIGLDKAKFETCLQGGRQGGKYASLIQSDVQDAVNAGGTGTPFTVVLGPTGKAYPISGAMPYSAVKSLIDVALNDK